MPHDEPEITQIAKFIATRIPTEGVAHPEVVDGWRGALRYARKTGIIDDLVDLVKTDWPEDQSLHQVLDEAKR
ncbi:MAG: hypothetical protein JRI25_15930 [Deltaproteobacteria bacterium]|nr:hypothetical protein [Deltaproteobacteria bacterium]MBW2256071.1 hypothetical protein [Deltaproteobacteria bacterium]